MKKDAQEPSTEGYVWVSAAEYEPVRPLIEKILEREKQLYGAGKCPPGEWGDLVVEVVREHARQWLDDAIKNRQERQQKSQG